MKRISAIFCDFDGTIIKQDGVNTFLNKYAPKKWLEYENLWIQGKISSKENATNQVALLPSLSEAELDEHIKNTEIDEYFKDFINFTKDAGIEFTILSDGFDLFIEKTLELHGIKDIKFYANHFYRTNTGFGIEFPYTNTNCKIGAGMCKCQKTQGKEFAYIGDGTSDLCIAKHANTLFATKKLAKYCHDHNINYHPFTNFKDIIDVLKLELTN